MAYVIAVCGSGGKTTLVKSLAEKYANENKKVCITTTTHMWYDEDVKGSLIEGTKDVVEADKDFAGIDKDVVGPAITRRNCRGELYEPGKVYYIANVNREKELITPLNESDYKLICEKFDYVIIEADGSRSMPMKIPRTGEPAIPTNVNEIIVVVGMEAVGREIGAVCHRFNEFYGNDKYLSDNKIEAETIVTEKLLDEFVGHYYVDPLKDSFADVTVSVHKTIFAEGSHRLTSTKRIAIVMCASGFSKRFGSNKLFAYVSNKKMYQLMIDKLLSAKEMLNDKFSKTFKDKASSQLKNDAENLDNKLVEQSIDIAVVTQYDEIINDKNYNDKVIMIKNENAYEGMSQSIKLAVEYFSKDRNYKCDAIVFVNADMPNLPSSELASFIYNSMLNKNGIAAMYTDSAKNPAYFEKEYFDELMSITGDRGPKYLLDENIMHLYRYYINPKYLVDIDTKEELYNYING